MIKLVDILNEDIIDGEIKCEKCGHTWKLAKGGTNPYLCHICDQDNSNQNTSIQVDEYDVENEQDLREFIEFMESYQQELNEADCDCLLEAKYQGRTVSLGKPMRGDSKKFKVYVKNPKTGKVVKVNFGQKGMSIKKNNPKRRSAFRARHNCDNPGPRTKARYWSCRKW
jgi:DNA-directed RNA polymerase subunit RPC12/RpoP